MRQAEGFAYGRSRVLSNPHEVRILVQVRRKSLSCPARKPCFRYLKYPPASIAWKRKHPQEVRSFAMLTRLYYETAQSLTRAYRHTTLEFAEPGRHRAPELLR